MINKKLPNILVINSQTMFKNNATGITERSILRNYPLENIVELFRWLPLRRDTCDLNIRSFQISEKVLPFNTILRKLSGNSTNADSAGTSAGISKNIKKTRKNTFILAIIQRIKFLGENCYVDIAPITKLLSDKNFKPDVVYTFGANQAVHNICLAVAKYYDIRIVLHYMDNWRETMYLNNPYLSALNTKINHSAEALEARSVSSIVISEGMRKAYTEKYKHKYRAIMNCIGDQDFIEPQIPKNNHTINIVYAGGLHLSRNLLLLDLEKAILTISEISGCNIKLSIYTSEESRKAYEAHFTKSVTEFCDYIPHDAINSVYESADLLVHVESFSDETIGFTKYSLSTKIPEYLASGKCMLCYAPENIEVYKYLKSYEAGAVTSSYSQLIETLTTLCFDAQMRYKYAKSGYNLAKMNHSVSIAYKTFVKVICENSLKKDRE